MFSGKDSREPRKL